MDILQGDARAVGLAEIGLVVVAVDISDELFPGHHVSLVSLPYVHTVYCMVSSFL